MLPVHYRPSTWDGPMRVRLTSKLLSHLYGSCSHRIARLQASRTARAAASATCISLSANSTTARKRDSTSARTVNGPSANRCCPWSGDNKSKNKKQRTQANALGHWPVYAASCSYSTIASASASSHSSSRTSRRSSGRSNRSRNRMPSR